MTQPQAEIELAYRDRFGRLESTILVTPIRQGSISNSGETLAKSARVGPVEPVPIARVLADPGEAARLPFPTWGGQESKVRRRHAGSTRARRPVDTTRNVPDIDLVEAELADLMSARSAWAKTKAGWDDILAPVFSRERGIKDEVRRTHGETDSGRIVFLFAGKGERKLLFAELDDLAEAWMPEKRERNVANTEVKKIQGEIDFLAGRLKKMKAKRQKGEKHAGG